MGRIEKQFKTHRTEAFFEAIVAKSIYQGRWRGETMKAKRKQAVKRKKAPVFSQPLNT